MSFAYIRKMPTVEEIINDIPLTKELISAKDNRDAVIKKVLAGEDKRFLIVIGPCSAHDENAVCEYVSRLAALQEKVREAIILIPRIYTNKPRTTGEGYKGMAHQPDPEETPNIVKGLKAIRRMHIRALSESGLSAADEMLYPGNYPYLEDVLSYVTIGARSVENQEHRLTVSGLDVPCGMKNPTSGDLTVMFNSIYAAQLPHIFVYNGWEVNTTGNPYAHGILRGAVNKYGHAMPNYHFEDLAKAAEIYKARTLKNPALIVDTNHSNSDKHFKEQPRIAKEIIHSMKSSAPIASAVKGLMIESYLVEGSQSVSGRIKGKSITDPCLGWEDSERLVLDIADLLRTIRK